MFNYEPLVSHLIEVSNTLLDQLDMIGSSVKYKELSPNWSAALKELNLTRLDVKRPSKFKFKVHSKPRLIKFSPDDRGLYTGSNAPKLLESMLWDALHANVMLDASQLDYAPCKDTNTIHPLVLVLNMLNKPTKVALVTNWIPYKDDEEKFFPVHSIRIRHKP